MPAFYDVVDTLHATYRQADHWIHRGYLPVRQASPGSGNHRSITDREAKLLRLMDQLVHIGFAPARAGELALVLEDDGHAALGPITLDIDLAVLAPAPEEAA